MPYPENESRNPLFFNPLEPYVGLSIDDLNRYLPAVQNVADLALVDGQVPAGLYLGDAVAGLEKIPENSIDLMISDPPRNPWRGSEDPGQAMTLQDYYEWNDLWLKESYRILKATGMIYLICDWRYSGLYQSLLNNRFRIQTRITWRDEAAGQIGRKATWRNCASDIWFATKTDDFMFDKQLAGATQSEETDRTNFWADIHSGLTLPMAGDRPEALLKRIIGSSSFKLGWVVDPFMRNGGTGVAAKKMGRRFIGFETNRDQLLMAMKRIDGA